MADVTVKTLVPATEFDLLTLDELKIGLGIPTTDTTDDAELQVLISTYSAIVADLCNRTNSTFAKEKVTETWREMLDHGRVFLTHYPVVQTDIESVQCGGALIDATAYELEEASGKLSHVMVNQAQSSAWPMSVIVTYTGGYELPDEAPLPLKQATIILIREERMKTQQAQVAGIRQLSHKDARVVFFDPNALLARTMGAKSSTQQITETLLRKYQRFWV